MDSSPEEWRRVKRFRNYQISSFGRVMDDQGHLVDTYLSRDGEISILLDSDEWMYKGTLWGLMLHNWFYGNLDEVWFSYTDGDKNNLHLDNLEPMTKDEVGINYHIQFSINEDQSRMLQRRPTRRGKKIRIKETGQVFDSAKECAEEIGGDRYSIYSVIRGARRSHKGFTFEWV